MSQICLPCLGGCGCVGVYSAVPIYSNLFRLYHIISFYNIYIIYCHCISTQSLVKFHLYTGHPAIPPFLCKVRLQADDPRVDDDEYPSTFGSTRASSDKPLKSLKSLTCRFVRLLQKALARSLKLYKEHAGSSCRENSLLRLVKVAYVRFDVSTWRAPSEASYSCCMV